MNKCKALVIFSGGQDSTTCLIQAIAEYGRQNVEVITFDYGQRHRIELDNAQAIAVDLGVVQTCIDTSVIKQTTNNALIDDSQTIRHDITANYPNTFVDGRNALFLLLAANLAKSKGIQNIIIGVCETDYSGYPDCRNDFINSMNVTLNLALDYTFFIKTPLMFLTKVETWQLADKFGYLEYIRQKTHTCYMGVEGGCGECPSCILRNRSLETYLAAKTEQVTVDNNVSIRRL